MCENIILALVYDVFDLSHGQVKFLCQSVISYTVQQPALEDVPVSLSVATNYPLIYQCLNLGSRQHITFCGF